jgi:hypothetical protein
MSRKVEDGLKDIATQLGGSVEVFRKSADYAADSRTVAFDARVPSLDALRGQARKATMNSTAIRLAKRGGRQKSASAAKLRDFSVQFRAKNTDSDSKVAIVSGKTKKIAYEQG